MSPMQSRVPALGAELSVDNPPAKQSEHHYFVYNIKLPHKVFPMTTAIDDTTIDQRIKNKAYENANPYPLRPPVGVIDENKSVLWNRHEVDRLREEFNQKKCEWRLESTRKETQFGFDVVQFLENEGFTSAQARDLYCLAWEQGHSNGYSEVFNLVRGYPGDFARTLVENKMKCGA